MSWKTNRRVKRAQQKSDNHPVLFLDVDGVISLFGFHPSGPPPGTFHSIDGILHCIGSDVAARRGTSPSTDAPPPGAGPPPPPRLRRLADTYELVWATGWEEKANEYLV